MLSSPVCLFFHGYEQVNPAWIRHIFAALQLVFSEDIRNHSGKIEHYYEDKLQNLKVPQRIFFHLVENASGDPPFAFMATYSEMENNQIVHHPHRYALKKHEKDAKHVVELLASIIKVEKKSPLISSLLESGELFYPIFLSSEEAYRFLKDIPLYEEAGIKCRIPNWWKRK